MCNGGLWGSEEGTIPVIIDVSPDEYLFLLKEKKSLSWKEFILGLVKKT